MICAIGSTMYLLYSLPLDIDTRKAQKKKGDVYTSVYESTYRHCSWLRNGRRWCSEAANTQKMRVPLRAITAQHRAELNWQHLAARLSRTRGLPSSMAALLLQRAPRLFWRCSKIGWLDLHWRTCGRLNIPHVEPISSWMSRDIFSKWIRYPVNCFEVISLEVI